MLLRFLPLAPVTGWRNDTSLSFVPDTERHVDPALPEIATGQIALTMLR